jgi:hypothetical protein
MKIAIALALAATVAFSAGTPARAADTAASPVLRVHKTATCSCCKVWVDQARDAGFEVEVDVVDGQGLANIKHALGVPRPQASCHTTTAGGYFIEGHVPFEDIRRLLAEAPEAAGIAVPGMPLGSPGMEAPGHEQPFATHLVGRDGEITVYQQHDPRQRR